jgi:methionyl-tRNA formyltransferase
MHADKPLKIVPEKDTAEDKLRPGVIQVGKRDVRDGTATTDGLLGEVQPVGRKAMAAADWGRGAAVPPGAVLDSAPPGAVLDSAPPGAVLDSAPPGAGLP